MDGLSDSGKTGLVGRGKRAQCVLHLGINIT